MRIARLFADLLADTTGFESGMKRADRSMGNTRAGIIKALGDIDKSFDNTGREILKLGTNLLAGISVGKVLIDLRSVITEMDNIGKASDRLGISTESFSKLVYVGKLADVTMEDLEKSIRTLQKTLVENLQGSTAAAGSFRALGVSAKDLINLPTEQAFSQIAVAVSKIENPAQRTTVAMELFGRSGLKIINLASTGADGLQDLYREAERIGLVFSRDAAGKAEEFNDSLTRLNESYRGLLVAFASSGALDNITSGINTLSSSMNVLVTVAELAAVVLVARVARGLLLTSAGWISNTIQITAYQAALARMAGVSATAAAGMGAMAGAAALFSRALALIGGPIGLAAIGIFVALSAYSKQAAENQAKLNAMVGEYQAKAQGMANASAAQRRAFLEDSRAKINAMIGEVNALAELIQSYESLGGLDKFGNKFLQTLGLRPDITTAKEQYNQLRGAIEEMMKAREMAASGGLKNTSTVVDEKAAERQAKLIKDIVDGLQNETTQLDVQIGMFGRKESAINRVAKEQEIANKLAQEGITLTLDQANAVNGYLEMIERQQELYKQLQDQEKALQKFADDAATAFTDFFENATTRAESFSDSIRGLGKALADMALKAAIFEPLQSSLGGIFGSILGTKTEASTTPAVGSSITSGLGNFLDGIINSFDVGTPYVTHDQVAQIHKGEAVLTPDEAAAWRNGGGGNVYNIDARGADAGAVRRIEQTLMTLAGPGRIEARVADAQRRGRL